MIDCWVKYKLLKSHIQTLLKERDEILEQEEACQNVHGYRDLLAAAREQLDEYIRKHTHDNTLRDAVSEGHHNDGEEAGSRLGKIRHLNIDDCLDHHHADQYQRTRCGRSGDNQKERGEEERQQEDST